MLGAPISTADREKLAFANAERLLGLDLSGSSRGSNDGRR